MKKNSAFSTIILIIVLLIGLSLLLYPTFSEWYNERFQARAIDTYSQQIAHIDNDRYREIWDSAKAYNQTLLDRKNNFLLSDEQKEAYNRELNIGDGIMGYIEIPSINVSLAIYHSTDDSILQVAIGHLDWTSLPTGGESTHCVLSGHRGLPSARLFTDLDKLKTGDYFVLHILDEELTYEVDQILIVEPEETDDLLIQPGKDLCTLVTCTPYGVNSHRLLVRGHRTENLKEAVVVRVTADAVLVEKIVVAPFILAVFMILMVPLLLIPRPGKRRNKKEANIKPEQPPILPDDGTLS